jgi:hypothetical protein
MKNKNFKATIIAPADLPAKDLKSLEDTMEELCDSLDSAYIDKHRKDPTVPLDKALKQLDNKHGIKR